MPTTLEIEVYDGQTLLASGTLVVDTSTTPPTGTFTPDGTGATQATANVSSWSSAPNGATNWNFTVSGQANGDFPLGVNGNQFTYSFTGHENAQGTNPGGHVTWPNGSPRGVGGDPPTWQSDATEDEPMSLGTAAK